MTDSTPNSTVETSAAVPPAPPALAEKLAVNRTGKLTRAQYRLALLVGLGALAFFLCPLMMVLQMATVLFLGDAPVPTIGSVIFTVIGVLFMLLMMGLIGTNALAFLSEAFMRRPVRVARGPLHIHVSEGNRPELPFSYIVGEYSFAPFVAPRDLPMRTGAPYLVYYSARSRLLLSITALDAPDADRWQPEF